MCAEAASTTAAQAHSGCNGMPTKPAPQKVIQLFKKPEVRTINATQTWSDAAAFSLRSFFSAPQSGESHARVLEILSVGNQRIT